MSSLATKKFKFPLESELRYLFSGKLGWKCRGQVLGEGGDLHVRERTAVTGGKRGHERAGPTMHNPSLPEIHIGRGFDVVQIRHHRGAILAFMADAADSVVKSLAVFALAGFEVAGRGIPGEK